MQAGTAKINRFTLMDSPDRYDQMEARLQQLEQELNASNQRIEYLENKMRGVVSVQRPLKNNLPVSQRPTLENYVGLKLIHFIGIIVLIIGLSIGVKYAIDINLISPSFRIVLAYAAGVLLLILSYRLRKRFELFSMILFSGSMASMYFTTYAAFEYYQMMTGWLAFSFMLLFTIFTVYNALKYDRSQIAMLGLVGAYGIPFFVRGNSSEINMLLRYVLLINLGVMFLSFRKYWPDLTYLAFMTSWIIYFSCIYFDESAVQTGSLQIFAFVFFALFVLSSLGFKLFRKILLQDTDSILLLANTIFLYVSYNILAVRQAQNSWAISALVVGVLYVVTAILLRNMLAQQRSLNNTLLGTGLAALASYVALQFSGFNITLIWLLMAIGFFIIGMYLKIKILRLASILLFAATLVKLLVMDSLRFTAVQKVTAYILTGTVLLIVSFLYQKFKKRIFNEE